MNHNFYSVIKPGYVTIRDSTYYKRPAKIVELKNGDEFILRYCGVKHRKFPTKCRKCLLNDHVMNAILETYQSLLAEEQA